MTHNKRIFSVVSLLSLLIDFEDVNNLEVHKLIHHLTGFIWFPVSEKLVGRMYAAEVACEQIPLLGELRETIKNPRITFRSNKEKERFVKNCVDTFLKQSNLSIMDKITLEKGTNIPNQNTYDIEFFLLKRLKL